MRVRRSRRAVWTAAVAVAAITALVPSRAGASATPFISGFTTISEIASTVPANGDINPYGVAVIHRSHGKLHSGDVLVSNFNASNNHQGTGSTIVEITPGGVQTQFASLVAGHLHGACPGGVGLTTALSVLGSGWVIVGSLPTSDGTAATARAGCLIILNDQGSPVATITGHGINGPWDMTAVENEEGSRATLFVTNVLNGTVKASPAVVNRDRIGLHRGGLRVFRAHRPERARHRTDRCRARSQRQVVRR